MSIRKSRAQRAALKKIRETLPQLELELLVRVQELNSKREPIPEDLVATLRLVADLHLTTVWSERLAGAIEKNASLLLAPSGLPNSMFSKLRGYGVQLERKLHKDERKSSTPKYKYDAEGRIVLDGN